MAKRADELSSLALRHHTFYLIQPAVRTGGAIFHHVTANLARAATTARLGRPPFYRSGIGRDAGCGGLALPLRIGVEGVVRRRRRWRRRRWCESSHRSGRLSGDQDHVCEGIVAVVDRNRLVIEVEAGDGWGGNMRSMRRVEW